MESLHPRVARRLFGVATLFAFTAFAPAARAQDVGVVRGRVTETASGRPIPDAQVTVTGSQAATVTNSAGDYILANVPAGQRQIVFRRLGYNRVVQTVAISAGTEAHMDATLTQSASQLDAVVVTSLGQTANERALGTAQQTVEGQAISQTQRENFINALQGRVAGVDVTSTSGMPGSSSVITIRGISSISSSNQPLIIVDGLPIDNTTTNTGTMASDAPTAPLAFNNRGVDFTNRAADINPEDIQSLTVLKGPEAAALYGIDAANGAIVITTKRGQSGGGFEYTTDFRMDQVREKPIVQNIYGPSSSGTNGSLGTVVSGALNYFGTPYPAGTKFYDNASQFFRTGATDKQSLAFSGASPSSNVSYRVSSSFEKQQGIVPNSALNKVNITGATQGTVTNWLGADLSMMYVYENNAQPFRGSDGPVMGLLVWPDTNNASNYLTTSGQRLLLTNLGAGTEVDNPFFNVNNNSLGAKTNRLISNAGITITPFSWGYLKSNIGVDAYSVANQELRSPFSALGFNQSGILDINDQLARDITAQSIFNVKPVYLGRDFSIDGLVGNSVEDNKSTTDGSEGTNFLDPTFVSINNTANHYVSTKIAQRRLVSGFGLARLSFRDYLFLTATGRNDWTSTIPVGKNSFFYPSLSASYVISDAFPGLQRVMTAKLRGAFAEVGRDALPYSYAATLTNETTTGGGYGFGFYGPNPNLVPEFAKSYEVGTELGFLQNRLGLDFTAYRKHTDNQIVQNVRESYGTGFILFNLNGASTQTQGIEAVVRASPIQGKTSWDITANFDLARGKTLSLVNGQTELYNSDTWAYGNIRNGTGPGMSTMSLTGTFYLRNKNGQLEIDPTTGLPLRSSTFIDGGYDRQPKYTIGLENNFRRGNWGLNVLFDIRRGGDIFNATEHYLTLHGLSQETVNRWTPVVVPGVLRDGKENSDNPTQNTIVVIPALNTNYYTNMSEELFIQKNINWLRMRDVTLSYDLPSVKIARLARSASLFITATDLFMWTNYTGLDPLANDTDATEGGSGGVGIDFANYPVPRGINFGLRVNF